MLHPNLGALPMMTDTHTRFSEIASQLKTLTDILKRTLAGQERRPLLKQFRALLDEVDRLMDSTD
jgi:hypothetical protein